MWDFPDPRIVGTRLFARGCDDAAGVASLVALLDEACRLRLRNGFHVLLTRAEESGFLGAIGACRARTLPEGSVVVTVEASQALPGAAHGNGPIIRVGDRVSIFSPNVTRALVEVARDLQRRRPDFRCQRKLMDGGMCESSIYMEYGYPAGGLSLPLGNYHNIGPCARRLRAEFIDVRDYENLIRLHVAIAQGFRSNRRDGRKSLKRYERLFLRNRPLLRHPRRGR
jgi:endoglucanase